MAAREDEIVTLKEGGKIELPRRILHLLGIKGNDKFKAVVMGNKCIQLLKLDEDLQWVAEDQYKIVFAGDVEGIGVADLLSIVNMARRTGVLVVVSDKTTKSVYFRQGEIVFASSNLSEERLGNFLYRTGKISKDDLEEAIRSLSKEKRIGSVLLEKKSISPKDLWWGVRYQIEEIIYSVFKFQKGFFFFVEGDLAEEDLVRVPFNTQKLLMEGFRRMDEWPLILEYIPSEDAVMEIVSTPSSGQLNPIMQQVFEQLDGQRDVAEVIRMSQLGEFNGFRVLYQLAKAGMIRQKGKAKVPQEEKEIEEKEGDRKIRDIVEKYNELYQQIYTSIADRINVQEALGSFFDDTSSRFKKLFEGVQMDEKGILDVETIIENARKAELFEAGTFQSISGFSDLFTFQLVLDGLNEFLNFMVFSLRNISSSQETEDLIRKVRDTQSQIRQR